MDTKVLIRGQTSKQKANVDETNRRLQQQEHVKARSMLDRVMSPYQAMKLMRKHVEESI